MLAGLGYVSPRQHYLRRLAAPHVGAAYAACCSVRVRGALDRCRFIRAARFVLGRDDGWLEALGTDAAPPTVCELDLRGLGADEQTRQIDRVWRAIAIASAAASAGIPRGADASSCVVAACGDDEHVMMLRIPAVVGDLPTLHRFVEDIDRAYHGAALAEAIGYGEFVEWQHELLTAADAGMGRAFWEERRAPERLAVRLPYDARISSDAFDAIDAAFSPAKEAIALDAECLSASAALAREMGVAAYVPLLTCWAILLERIADAPGLASADVGRRGETAWLRDRRPVSKELVVGMTLDGRVQDDLAGAAGPYTEAVPLRVIRAPEASFRERLDAMRQEIAQAERWRTWFTWPEASAESAEVSRSAQSVQSAESAGSAASAGSAGSARSAGFAESAPFVPFLFETLPVFAAAGCGTLRYAVERQQACLDRFTMKLTCGDAGDESEEADDTVTHRLDLWYDPACYDATAARTLAAQYAALLRRCVVTPDDAIETGWMLDTVERDRILVEWNRTDDASLIGRCVHELFEAQVERTPDLVAIRQDGVALTYRELNTRANRLAHRLRDRYHAGPEVFVGLCLPRGVNLVVAILATLKAGAAYVPLDPSQPVARLGAILDRVRPAVVLSERDLLPRLREDITALWLDDDDGRQPLAAEAADAADAAGNSRPQVHAAHAAYVLHTSGSTGEPKGVVITHGALANYVRWAARAYEVTAGTAAPLHTPIGFDLTLTSLFPPLIAGGVVELLPDEPGLEALSRFLGEDEGPALVKLTPAHLDLLTELTEQPFAQDASGGSNASIARLLTLVIGGEALAAETIQAWAARAPRSRFVNEYGPTEATVGCCVYEPRDPARERGGVRIGRPIANTRLFVLDDAGDPVPIGCAGALHIAGDGVARGYLHAAAATAASFVPNPFGPAGSRMYRTGDRARYWPDGGLEFLGREDEQIKLHGFRIEPDEIERALRQHPQVRQAAVMVVGARRQARLHACIAASEPAPAPDALRVFLDAHVPAYMMPATFAIMERLPLTPNGKIDRQALAAAAESGDERTPQRVAPRDEWEAHLVRIWEEVLQRRPIGVRDRFFDLGGQSFLAIRLVARVEREFGRMLPVTILFEEGTIERMAAALVDAGDELGSPLVRMQPDGDAPPFFCVQPIGGSVYSFVPLARRLAPDQPFVGLGGRYWLDAADLKDDTLEALAARYVRAMRQEMPADEYHLGGWSSGGVVAFEMARQLAAEGHRVARLVLIDSVPPEPLVELDDATFLRRVIAERTGTDVTLDEQVFESLAPELRLAAVRDAAVAHGLLDLDIRTEQVQAYVTQQQRAARLVCSYKPGAYDAYDGVVTLLRASDSHEVLPAESDGDGDADGDDGASTLRDLSYGWTQFLTQPIDIHIVPGRHTTMVMDPHAEALAAELSRVLTGKSSRD
jgi:amino acid adenylation domain-containing protein